jgi:hypothetical protein
MLRVKASGAVQHLAGEWSAHFGPLSNVDAEIPDSGGETLRSLMEAGMIPADVFEEVNEPADQPVESDEPTEERE